MGAAQLSAILMNIHNMCMTEVALPLGYSQFSQQSEQQKCPPFHKVLSLHSAKEHGIMYNTWRGYKLLIHTLQRYYEVHDLIQTAYDNHVALKDFFLGFPEFTANKLYVIGESYGGIYAPMLSSRLIDDQDINFKVWFSYFKLQRFPALISFRIKYNNVKNQNPYI